MNQGLDPIVKLWTTSEDLNCNDRNSFTVAMFPGKGRSRIPILSRIVRSSGTLMVHVGRGSYANWDA